MTNIPPQDCFLGGVCFKIGFDYQNCFMRGSKEVEYETEKKINY